MEEIVSLVVANGIFAVLFCGLLIYELKDSRARESNYRNIISALSERLKTVDEIKSDTQEIRADVKLLRSDGQSKKRTKADKHSDGGEQCTTLVTA